MQSKWTRRVLEQVVPTALKVSLTVQEICEVLARHWGGSTRKEEHEHEERRPE